MAEEARFTWVEPYKAIASELLNRRGQEQLLLDICRRHANLEGVDRMDPLTFMAVFNRRQKDSTREAIVKDVLGSLGLASVDAPRDFAGVPVSDPRRWRYMDGLDASFDEKWRFFEAALSLADAGEGADAFAELFDAVLNQKNIGRVSLTESLFWCRPDCFITLDANTVRYLAEAYSVSVPEQVDGRGYLALLHQIRSATSRPFPELSANAYGSDAWLPLPEVYDPGLTTEDWAELVKDEGVFTPVAMSLLSRMIDLDGQATCKELEEAFGESSSHYGAVGTALGERVAAKRGIPLFIREDGGKQAWSIPFVGRKAAKSQPGEFCWKIRPELYDALMEGGVELPNPDAGDSGGPVHWVIAPGESAWAWGEFTAEGIAAIGWDYLGDLSKYSSKVEIAAAINAHEGTSGSRKNDAGACYLFANHMKPGDIIYAKQGLNTLLGRGVVTSHARFDDSRAAYKHVVSVDWEDVGSWSVEGFNLPQKTLTGWYPKYKELDAIIDGPAGSSSAVQQPDLYGDADFLAEVYMDAGDYEDLKGLARIKKNIILQGAPGTGKTFAAERLAWALMGCRDKARVQKVQFHQSTSYDEFVIGFRPNAQGGFAIEEGPFVRFCDRAASDPANEHFLIIDEINRANVSKVFGELLMLIEDSHRGEELLLTAGKRMFSVPKNLTIIGMMNTADRGLALIDYALRRRFAFFEMEPALDNSAFKERVGACLDKRMLALVEAVRKLNAKIADDPTLGAGFRIGHSYFCRDKEKEPGCVDTIVKYELVPLVREYWFDDRKTAEAEVAKLEALL